MTAVPLGQQAYERLAAGTPEVELLNRYVEVAPQNLREHSLLLSRASTTPRLTFDPGAFAGLGSMRGDYFFPGLFSDSMFVVCGENLYRVNTDLSKTLITGVVNGTGHPSVGWQKGIGYERLFISDGLLLQFYAGTTAAKVTLTLGGVIVNGTDKIEIGGTYYTWGTAFSGSDAGSSAHPFVVKPTDTDGNLDPLNQLVLAIMNSGVAGSDYSATISGPNTQVMATSPGAYPPEAPTTLITALVAGTGGNSITSTVTGGAALSFSSATLINGGIDALEGVTMPGGVAASSLTQVSSYVLVGIANSQMFYWVNPGEVVIDPLDFAEKESSPDNIVDMKTIGDQALIMGEGSTENWYATGDLDAPFAPIEGRVYQRGCIAGTACIVNDAVLLVGNDMVVYEVGYAYGSTSDWGVHRISNHGIEERIRRQVRREQGLTP